MSTHNTLLALALAFAAPAFAGPASSSGTVELTIVGQMEQEYRNDKGEKAKRLVPITKIVPGDEVIYTITYENKGKQPADRVVVTDPIPPEVAYVDGSAFGPGTEIEFSADGGKTWGLPATLKVKGADGKDRPAVAADYTHIRWKLAASVQAGQKGFVRFRAVLK
jgi:uncharacterized repeat protein (TIGR01451 family)